MEQLSPAGKLLDSHTWFAEDVTCLDGKWRYMATDGQELDGWLEKAFDDRKWNRVLLPEPGNEVRTGAGLYRKGFQLSRDRGSRRVILRITEVPEALSLWINGQFQGAASGLWREAEFDITEALHADRNQVCIRSSGPLTGLVGLYVQPRTAITDVRFQCRSTGQGESALALQVRAACAEGFTVRMALMDGQEIVSYAEGIVRDGVCEALLGCEGIRFWHPEVPSLYRLALILWDGIAIHHTREKIIGIRAGAPAEPVFAAIYTPTADPSHTEAELKILKDHNFNGILMPGTVSEPLLSCCDRLGLYVIEQTGISRDNCTEDVLARLSVPRASHPCLVGWDLEVRDSISLTVESVLPVHPTLPEAVDGPVCLLGAYRNTAYDGKTVPGFVRENGALSPELRNLGVQLAPVVCRFKDGQMTVENRSRFLSTQDYDGRLVLYRDGVEMLSKAIEQDVPPGGSATFPVETRYDIYKPGRYHLAAEFRRKEDGVLLARDQWEVGNLRHIYNENPGGTIREESGRLLMRSQDSGYIIDRSTGCPQQITSFGQELLAEGMIPVFSGTGSGLRLPDEWERFTARWKKPKPAILEVDQMTRQVTASFRLGSGLMQTYRLFADGSLSLELRLRTGKTAPDRMGWKCRLDPRLNQCAWFGLGPDACGEGCFFGIHSEMPGNGEMREPVYNLTLSDGQGHGIRLRSEEGFQFSLWGQELTLMLSGETEWKPHTTYTFQLTIGPLE